ncbi:MAG: hypothetical protein J0L93_09080 [Deltaproteobacteria bacterium]|nr:hypothetical protein [Deltaproteobacteria bacterium]
MGFFQRSAGLNTPTQTPAYEILALDRNTSKKSDSLILVGMKGERNGFEFFPAISATNLSAENESRKVFTNTETGESLTTRMRTGMPAELQRPVSDSSRINLSTEGLLGQRLQILEMDSSNVPLLFPAEWIQSKESLERIYKLEATNNQQRGWKKSSSLLELEVFKQPSSNRVLILVSQKLNRFFRAPTYVREFLMGDITSSGTQIFLMRPSSEDYFFNLRINSDKTGQFIFRPLTKTESNLEIPPEGISLTMIEN